MDWAMMEALRVGSIGGEASRPRSQVPLWQSLEQCKSCWTKGQGHRA